MSCFPVDELRLGNETIEIGQRPLLMGIVNVTPDSFSDGGKFFEPQAAIAHAEKLVSEGADWLDIGGESTRPGAEPIPPEEELRRVEPVLEGLSESEVRRSGWARRGIPISIDTYKPQVARRAVELGASIINDVTGFRDPEMIEVAADCEAVCVCMHMLGTPKNMQERANYEDVVEELLEYFESRIEAMGAGGIDRKRIVVDPGIGFAKRREHNLAILRRLADFGRLRRPVMLGTSRKRIIGELSGRPKGSRLSGTIATAVVGFLRGARLFRVHEVGPVREALSVVCAIEAK